MILLDSPWTSAIFFAFYAMASHLSIFLCKWVVLWLLLVKSPRKFIPPIIHSLAFGGRGVYIIGKSKSSRQVRGKCRNPCSWVSSMGQLKIPDWLAIAAAVFIWSILENTNSSSVFDATMGFPGEGPETWSEKHHNLSIATWNTRSLSFLRFNSCKNLGYDVLAITELWRTAKKYTDGTVSFIHSEPKINVNTGAPSFPDDVASGVGILLSERAQSKYMSHGSPCERIVWVRLKGPVTNLFIIAVYVPHRARVEPCQNDTLSSLIELLKKVPKNDCIVVLGDLNEQLPSNIESLTGKWAYDTKSANADEILHIMRMFDLFAVSTKFQPKKNSSSATYVFCEEGSFMPKVHQFQGSKVRALYKGNMVDGTVGDLVQGGNNKLGKRWIVNFADGYSTICGEKKIRS